MLRGSGTKVVHHGERGPVGPRGKDGVGIKDIELKEGFVLVTLDDGEIKKVGPLQIVKGDQGPKGDRGNQGEPGQKGEQGAAGPKGNDGISVEDLSIVDGYLIANLGSSVKKVGKVIGPKGDKGDRGEDGTSINDISVNNDGNLVFKLSNGAQYICDNVKGPKGDKGQPGEKGDQGEQGAKGEKGEPGKDAQFSTWVDRKEISYTKQIGTDKGLALEFPVDHGLYGVKVTMVGKGTNSESYYFGIKHSMFLKNFDGEVKKISGDKVSFAPLKTYERLDFHVEPGVGGIAVSTTGLNDDEIKWRGEVELYTL